MVLSAQESDHGSSLARLRLFLAPHAPAKLAEHSGAGSSHDAEATTEPQQLDDDADTQLIALDETTRSADVVDQIDDEEHQSNEPALHEESVSENSTSSNGISTSKANEDPDSRQHTITAAGVAASIRSLNPSSKEFARVKYFLQCCLPGVQLRGSLMIWDMQNPALVAQYAQHAKGLLELDSWVAVNDLGANLADMHSFGFTSLGEHTAGMKFTTGNLHLDRGGRPNRTRQLVLCKIAVGRSVVIHREDEAHEKLPSGYHSYYLQEDEVIENGREEHHEDGEGHRVALERGYYHEYILTNPLQVLPQYLVRFSTVPIDADKSGTCGLCEKQTAVIVCKACSANLCEACDDQVHSANKIASRHSRTPVDTSMQDRQTSSSDSCGRGRRHSAAKTREPNGIQLDEESGRSTPAISQDLSVNGDQTDHVFANLLSNGLARGDDGLPMCRSHTEKPVEFFCPVCDVPICVNCKMVGDHSVGDNGAHRLLTIADAYEACLRETLKPDPLLESRRSLIDSKLRALRALEEKVEQNRRQVQEAIEAQYRRAMDQLTDAIASRTATITSEILEFERQAQQIDWVDESLEDHRAALSPVEFLAAWSQHKLLRADQHDFPPLDSGVRGADQVKPDVELVGELHVLSTEQLTRTRFQVSLGGGREDASVGDAASSPSKEMLLSPRRLSDTEIRRRLLSIKALPAQSPSDSLSSPSRSSTVMGSPSRPLSPSCQKMVEDIKADLLARYTAANSPSRLAMSRAGTFINRDGARTPGKAAVMGLDSLGSPREFSTLPTGRKPSDGSAPRLDTEAWSSLLRQEMGHSAK